MKVIANALATEDRGAAALVADLLGCVGGADHLELAATVEQAAGAVQRFVERIDAATGT